MDELNSIKEKSLLYHSRGKKGKLEVNPTKPIKTQEDLSLAYTPGVAVPCIEIHNNEKNVWEYTSKGNLVAVVSDGTAVLGLGNIGALASLPVMEGKAVLFKRFAGINACPLCIDSRNSEGRTNSEKFVDFISSISPSFGGINLEDIAAPACFEIEEKLRERMPIPVFHDDQHGTAIITGAALLNSLELTGKKIEDVKVVINGAGAAGLASCNFYIQLGVKKENLILCDSKGVIYKGREGINPYKERIASKTSARTLREALEGADVFLGVSVSNILSKEMVLSMNSNPIIFALANPIPEIMPSLALEAGAAIVGTGRSDFPNQINNVLGFPGIFRGSLDVQAKEINEEMKRAAALALSELAKERIPSEIKNFLNEAYSKDAEEGLFEGKKPLKKSYVIPKPLDPRVVPKVAAFVAKAAIDSGAAGKIIEDLSFYESDLLSKISDIIINS